MKFAHALKEALERDGYPAAWIAAAVPYSQLKKCLKNVSLFRSGSHCSRGVRLATSISTNLTNRLNENWTALASTKQRSHSYFNHQMMMMVMMTQR
jgi:hypothetical protein